MTLAELRRLVTNYSGRTDPDFLNNVDDMIRLGHRYVERAWLGREQQFMYWEQQGVLAAGQFLLPLPAHYRHSAELRVTAYPAPTGARTLPWHQLERVPLEAMVVDAPWRLSDGTTIDAYDYLTRGEPRVYAVAGRMLEVRPTPAAPVQIVTTASGWASPLTYDSDETVVSQAAPDAVLYAALREAWSFLGDPVQKATWEGEAIRAIEAWMRDGVQEEIAAQGLPLVMQEPG
jgi:hypothetical protein